MQAIASAVHVHEKMLVSMQNRVKMAAKCEILTSYIPIINTLHIKHAVNVRTSQHAELMLECDQYMMQLQEKQQNGQKKMPKTMKPY